MASDHDLIPASFVMGPHVWRIIHDQDGLLVDGGAHGQASDRRKVICVDASLTGTALLEVLLHEVLHACMASTQLVDDDTAARAMEESAVLGIAANLLDALRRNPGLVSALLADLPD